MNAHRDKKAINIIESIILKYVKNLKTFICENILINDRKVRDFDLKYYKDTIGACQ